MTDARFEDATPADRPLKLKAETEADLAVISSLVQDAVGKAGEIIWARGRRRLVLLLNRFRWEDAEQAEAEGRAFERVQAALSVENVERVRARGLEPGDGEVVYAVLAASFVPRSDDPEECGGTVTLTIAGDGALAADVEALEVTLSDVTRPWVAAARQMPTHDSA